MNNLTNTELLRYVDRSDPTVRLLCERLEEAIDIIDQAHNQIHEIRAFADRLSQPVQAE